MGLQEREDVGFREVEAQGFHGDFEFVVIDIGVFVKIKERELKYAVVNICPVKLIL